MASEVTLPELGENLKGGEVLEVRVAQGDEVSKGQTILEIEAEKSTVEVPAPFAGRVSQMLVKKGDTVKTGQPLCLVEAGDGKKDGGAAPTAAKPAATPEQKDKAAPAAPPAAKEPARPEGDRRAAAEAPALPTTDDKLIPAGPATRRLARELGVDLRLVKGTARGDRVTQDDVKAYVKQLTTSPAAAGAPRTAVPPMPDFERWGAVERKPFESVRRKTADQMSLAWSLIPHVTQQDLADITDLDAFRRQQAEGKGPKLTVTAFVLKAAAIALRQFPQFNASLDIAAGQLVLKRYYHLGVAVDTERGLLVPVLRDVDKKSVQQLAVELTEVAERARQKKITADDMRGGTFTITNLGGIGGTGFSPIVNYPEVAILGLSRGRLQPVWRGEQFVPRLLMPLSLSYDHRVIDGADAARFTRRIAEFLENPLVMLLHA